VRDPYGDRIRRRALVALGAFGDEGARQALEQGRIEMHLDVASWEGSRATVHGHRAVLLVPKAVHALVARVPAAEDALAAALAVAVAEDEGSALYDWRCEVDPEGSQIGSPYRSGT
jgi:hypothetical protein